MNPTDLAKLGEAAKTALENGKTPDEIRGYMKGAGYSDPEVDEVMTSIESPSAPEQPKQDVTGTDPNAAKKVGSVVNKTKTQANLTYKIVGEAMQSVNITLKEGDKVYAEAGKMFYMTDNIKMDTKARGGVGGAFKRWLAQESLFTTEFETVGGQGIVAFAGSFPGKIRHFGLKEGEILLAQKDAFMCAQDSVLLDIAFAKKFGAGFFGGEGFILEKLVGPGDLWIHAGGDFVEFDLEKGQSIKVDTGCLVAFDESVTYDIERAGGIKTSFFGGEGFFLAKMTGPGRVLLQSMPISKMIASIGAGMGDAASGDSGTGAAASIGGSLIKGAFRL